SALFTSGRLDLKKTERLSRLTGRERLVLDLSCRRRGEDWVVVTDRWQTFTDMVLTSRTLEELSSLCDEFLIHGVDVEGKRCGIEDELVRLLASASSVPVTYAGGVAAMDDIKKIALLGKGRIDFTIGSALDIFGGSLPLEEVISTLSGL
ncbi:MAG: hypothetical protein JXA95_17060, partial [Spirochaetales bacterium]|nr:hypothetical protein [Spirochaetales bacterium]